MPFDAARHHRVAIIGAGFSGLGLGIKLREAGEEDFVTTTFRWQARRFDADAYLAEPRTFTSPAGSSSAR